MIRGDRVPAFAVVVLERDESFAYLAAIRRSIESAQEAASEHRLCLGFSDPRDGSGRIVHVCELRALDSRFPPRPSHLPERRRGLLGRFLDLLSVKREDEERAAELLACSRFLSEFEQDAIGGGA